MERGWEPKMTHNVKIPTISLISKKFAFSMILLILVRWINKILSKASFFEVKLVVISSMSRFVGLCLSGKSSFDSQYFLTFSLYFKRLKCLKTLSRFSHFPGQSPSALHVKLSITLLSEKIRSTPQYFFAHRSFLRAALDESSSY